MSGRNGVQYIERNDGSIVARVCSHTPETIDQADIHVENHGSIFLLTPWSDAAETWLHEVTGDEAQWFGKSLVVEPRYVADIVSGAIEAGFEVQ